MAVSVGRVIDLLAVLANDERGMTLPELSNATGVNRTSLARIIGDLVGRDVLVASGSPVRYSPGLELWKLGLSSINHRKIRSAIWPHCAELCRQIDSFVNIALVDGKEHIVFVESLNCVDGILSSSFFYRRLELMQAVSGKVIAAFLEPFEEIGTLSETSPDSQELIDEFQAIRKQGYGRADVTHTPNVTALAFPVFERSGRPVAVINLPRYGALDDAFLSCAVPRALDAARRASAALGFDPRRESPFA
jgi:DNA-binding IclR family transcriptional regulator